MNLHQGDRNTKFLELLDYRDSKTVRIQHTELGYEEYTKSEIIGILAGFCEQDEIETNEDDVLHITLEVIVSNRAEDEWYPQRPDFQTWDDEQVRHFIYDSYGDGAYNLYESAHDVTLTHIQ